jgi:DNA-binding NarL/FixJ family response regulator
MNAQLDGALRVVVGENNSDLALTLKLLLDAEPDIDCLGTASSSREVLQMARELAPNAFVIDFSLDDGSSLPLIRSLRGLSPAAVIVVYTGYANGVVTEQCLHAGADSVVVKTGEFDELATALRVSKGK